jgi:hypothetical protein
MALLANINEPSAALSHRVTKPHIQNLLVNLNVRVFIFFKAVAYASRWTAYSFRKSGLSNSPSSFDPITNYYNVVTCTYFLTAI